MPSLPDRVRAAKDSGHFVRLAKFAAVSVISTLVTQAILAITYDVLAIGPAWVCNVIATVIATFPAYWLNRTWTWGKRGKSNWRREVAPFWIIAFIGLVLSTIAVDLAAHNADALSHSHAIQKIIVQLANLVTYGLIWVGRYFIFNRFMFGGGHTAPTEMNEVPGEVEAIVLEEHRVHGDRQHSGADGPVPEEPAGLGQPY